MGKVETWYLVESGRNYSSGRIADERTARLAYDMALRHYGEVKLFEMTGTDSQLIEASVGKPRR